MQTCFVLRSLSSLGLLFGTCIARREKSYVQSWKSEWWDCLVLLSSCIAIRNLHSKAWEVICAIMKGGVTSRLGSVLSLYCCFELFHNGWVHNRWGVTCAVLMVGVIWLLGLIVFRTAVSKLSHTRWRVICVTLKDGGSGLHTCAELWAADTN